ncbi:MAG: hypothetical protein LH616_06510 [Ilumatobacteraceae bacterium]|nr:hypothetical protein [Ilumatobacteraceae bacterium]
MVDYLVLTIDVVDGELQSAFWCGALHYEQRFEADQFRGLFPREGKGMQLLLQQVAEPKSAKNRMHIDLHVVDVEAEVGRLVALGATEVARERQFDMDWVTMHDPEGNEFCVVPS